MQNMKQYIINDCRSRAIENQLYEIKQSKPLFRRAISACMCGEVVSTDGALTSLPIKSRSNHVSPILLSLSIIPVASLSARCGMPCTTMVAIVDKCTWHKVHVSYCIELDSVV